MTSLLLSWIALGGALINRDGIFYVDAARAMLEQGFGLQRHGIDWQFLSMLMAGLSALTGLAPETSGHLLNAFLLAGTCSLIVAITRRRLPEAAWAACLVVLAMPAYNGYRGELLREYGFWFFCLLAFWLAIRWEEAAPRWREAIACQLALGIAALFRLEAVVFYPALMLWQAFAAPPGQRLRRALMLGSLPLAGAALAGVFVGSGLVVLPNRVGYYIEAANPLHKLRLLGEAAGHMSESVLSKYSREEAAYVLFFGLLSIIPVKFLKMTGVFIVPLAYAFVARPAKAALSRWQPLPWAFFAYLLVLAAFVTHQFFLVGRYVSLLNLLAVPVAAAGLAPLMQRFPRWKMLMVALALLAMTANVVSISPRKTHIVEAGHWLGAHATDGTRVGVDNARIAYYAGWRVSHAVIAEDRILAAQTVVGDRETLAAALMHKHIDMVAVEAPRKDAGVEKWLADHRLQPVQRFANKAGDAVIVAVPAKP